MRSAVFCVAFACLLAGAFAAEGAFDYRPSAEWTGACGTGEQQSPINIDTDLVVPATSEMGAIDIQTMGILNKYTVYFTGVALEAAFESWEVEADVRIPANAYTIGDSETVKAGDMLAVEPLQMHIHTMSEHTLDGLYAPAELHIVTRVKDGESDYCDKTGGCLAVFGIMLTFNGEGAKASRAIRKLFNEIPGGVGVENGIPKERKLNLDSFLPENKDYYNYLGSLTTPPCTEIVTWHVFLEPVHMSAQHLEDHQAMVSFTPGTDCTFTFFNICSPPREKTNYRPVQPYYGRDVYLVQMSEDQ